MSKYKASIVTKELKKLYPNAKCALNHKNPFELLIATILSAQCTDKRVNIVTETLFKRYPTAKKMSDATVDEIRKEIKSINFFNNKAKFLKGTATKVVQNNNTVPDTMEGLILLNGVSRKTANVVLQNCFDKNIGVVVDTHVGRISNRIGLTDHTDPKKIEPDLMDCFPIKEYMYTSHRFIDFGRAICIARKPRCGKCPLQKNCRYYKEITKKVT